MKALVVPEVKGKWQVKDVPTPEPKANQVLIKIHASGLCYTDVHITEGLLPFPIEFPRTVGHEPVGEIVKVGAEVDSRKIGDRVGVLGFRKLVVVVNGVLEEKIFFANNKWVREFIIKGAMQNTW